MAVRRHIPKKKIIIIPCACGMPYGSEKLFKSIFGFNECAYDVTQRMLLQQSTFECTSGREKCTFEHPVSHRKISSGWHHTPSVLELRRAVVTSLEQFERRHPGYLAKVSRHRSHLHGGAPQSQRGHTRLLRHVVGDSYQMHFAYPGAFIQAASQFNALEFCSPEVTPEEGVANYVYDETQGPACAVACLAGTAYRNYLIHPDLVRYGCLRPDTHASGTSASATCNVPRGQRHDHQLDMLAEVTRFLTDPRGPEVPGLQPDTFYKVRNGYFFLDVHGMPTLHDRLQRLAQHLDQSVDALLDRVSERVRIGVVEDVTVVSSDGHDACASDNTASAAPPTVSQSYNSALSLDSFVAPDAQAAVATLAQCVLNGSYEATLLAGIGHTLRALDAVATDTRDQEVAPQLPPIFLTKVGGGVFHNKSEWIKTAIERALCAVRQWGVPLDVCLVHFRQIDRFYEDL